MNLNKFENELNEVNQKIGKLKNIIKEKEIKINEEKKFIQELKNLLINNNLNINKELMDNIKLTQKLINDIQLNIPEINLEEKMISVIFNSFDQNICCSIICKKTDNFCEIEQKLYNIYPEYKNTNNIFIVNGYKIDKKKNLDDNKIKNNDIISFNLFK